MAQMKKNNKNNKKWKNNSKINEHKTPIITQQSNKEEVVKQILEIENFTM